VIHLFFEKHPHSTVSQAIAEKADPVGSKASERQLLFKKLNVPPHPKTVRHHAADLEKITFLQIDQLAAVRGTSVCQQILEAVCDQCLSEND
jgi:hypothetical protein